MKTTIFASMLLIATILSSRVSATAIIVIYTPDTIYFAADSQIVHIDGSGFSYGCKIHVTEKFVWASAGLLSGGNVNLREIANHVLTDFAPFDIAVNEFQARLSREYPDLRKEAIGVAGHDLGHTADLDVVVAASKTPGRMTRLVLSEKFTERTSCPGSSCPVSAIFRLGEVGEIERTLNEQNNIRVIWRKMGIREALKYLITKQQKATPNSVGGPISIVGIDRSGPQWIDRGACD
jgi:hypothetical protein